MDTEEKHIKAMIAKAGGTKYSDDALKFAQAAFNAANAMCSLETAKAITPKK